MVIMMGGRGGPLIMLGYDCSVAESYFLGAVIFINLFNRAFFSAVFVTSSVRGQKRRKM